MTIASDILSKAPKLPETFCLIKEHEYKHYHDPETKQEVFQFIDGSEIGIYKECIEAHFNK